MASEVAASGDQSGAEPRQPVRASHADRDRAAEVLRVAAGDGRITAEELDERLEAALTARTNVELEQLTSDLGPGGYQQAKDLIRIDQKFGDLARTGRWVVPRRMEITLVAGDAKLDFTDAVITHDMLRIDIDLKIGADLTIVTRPGIVVDADDIAAKLGDVKIRHQAADTAAPTVLRIELAGRITGGNVLVRPPRRTSRQWLAARRRR